MTLFQCEYCTTFTSSTKCALIKHEKSCYKRSPQSVCPSCNVSFQSASALSGHTSNGSCHVAPLCKPRKRNGTSAELKQITASPQLAPSGKRMHRGMPCDDGGPSHVDTHGYPDVTPHDHPAPQPPPPPISIRDSASKLFAPRRRELTLVELACEFEPLAEYIAETRLPRGDHAEVRGVTLACVALECNWPLNAKYSITLRLLQI